MSSIVISKTPVIVEYKDIDDPCAITRTSAFGDKARLAGVALDQVPVIKICGSSPFSNSTEKKRRYIHVNVSLLYLN